MSPLLDPERAARLTLASGPEALTLNGLLRRLVNATWGAPASASPRLAGLQRVSQRVVLDALLDLAARPEAAPEVRALTLATLVRLRDSLKLQKGSNPEVEAHLRLAQRDVTEFLEHPELRKTRPRQAVPPGRPIG